MTMKAEYRPHVAVAWYESQWSFFWTIVGAILTAGAFSGFIGWLLFLAVMNGLTVELAKSTESMQRQAKESVLQVRARANAEAERRRPVTVAPDTVENCLNASGGVADEQFARCRRGYTYTPQ